MMGWEQQQRWFFDEKGERGYAEVAVNSIFVRHVHWKAFRDGLLTEYGTVDRRPNETLGHAVGRAKREAVSALRWLRSITRKEQDAIRARGE